MKKSDQCVVPECQRKIFIKKHKLCKTHAHRLYQFGDPGGPILNRKKHKPYWPLVLNKK